uniref:Interferon-induced protein 44-like isoform X2 n=1 Tax=Crassostrea virginica TaxID=6565 RepID=A0A8B8B1W2_CRAVI|nr:interferon-induced protein 44-like isoform X2 [Crassostrea virginica]
MEYTEDQKSLDTEIEILKEKIRKIEGANNLLESVAEDQKKLADLENSWFAGIFYRAKIQDLRRNIEVKKEAIITQNLRSTPKKNVDELKDELKTLEGARDARMERVQWEGFPEKLDKKIETNFLERFRNLPTTIHGDINFVNITMFGKTGAGKSSFLNTVVTALMNTNTICRDYNSAPGATGESKTKTFQLEKLTVEDKKDIPIRLYDCPGISNDEHDTMDLDVLEAVINGHIKGDSKFNPEEIRNKNGESYRANPSLKNEMHCIVFVINARTNLQDPDDETLKKIKALQQRINGACDVKQIAIVTNIDKIGVQNNDMEHVFKYSHQKRQEKYLHRCSLKK